MPYLLLGVLLLVGMLLLVRAFARADPAQLARFLRWFVATLGIAGLAFWLLFLLASERIYLLVPTLMGLGVAYARGRRIWDRWWSAVGAGGSSSVETEWLRMQLDHETGTMDGTVRRGAFQGRRLHELAREELVQLWRDLRAADEASADLLEAYLDRLSPDWREASAPGGDGAGRPRAAPADAMTVEEAYAVLGLAPGADEAAIKEAHRQLMMKLHPDHGGSTWLAAKINRAKELLLGGRR
jgi:hypothetical protein